MGTRVDFYVGRGEQAEWLGSYPFDGYPDGVFGDKDTLTAALFCEPLPSADEWREWVSRFLGQQEDRASLPEHGWPWPWDTSATTDYAYAWDEGAIYGSCFGHEWFRVDPTKDDFGEPTDDDEEGLSGEKTAVFPDMSSRKAVTYGRRSGLIVLGIPRDDS